MASGAHRHRIQPGITSRFNRDELRARLRRVDLVAADIDECLFPGFSQSYLGHRIFFNIVTRPHRTTDLRFVPQLLHGGAYIRKVKLLDRLGRTPDNATLMRRYEHSMWGVPETYFTRGIKTIPTRSHPGVEETLALLGRSTPVGLISFGINLIADEYMRHLNDLAARSYVAFAEANTVVFEPGPDGRLAFAGYHPRPQTEPRDKRDTLERRLQIHGAECPLVMGNGRDDCEMAILAEERSGLSLGFQPKERDLLCFDLVVSDWRAVHGLLSELI